MLVARAGGLRPERGRAQAELLHPEGGDALRQAPRQGLRRLRRAPEQPAGHLDAGEGGAVCERQHGEEQVVGQRSERPAGRGVLVRGEQRGLLVFQRNFVPYCCPCTRNLARPRCALSPCAGLCRHRTCAF